MVVYARPEAYESWMGRWSRRLVRPYLAFLQLTGDGRYLDVGAGTGVLTRALVDMYDRAEAIGLEPSASYVEYARQVHRLERLRFQTGDAMAIPFADGSFNGTLAMLIFQEIPDPVKAVAEMVRVTRPGGVVATCQWDFRDGLPMLDRFWSAVREVIPEEAAQKEASERVPLGYSDRTALGDLWIAGGLTDVETARLDISMEFSSFEDYWGPFMSRATATSSFAPTLSGDERTALIARLRTKLLGDGPDRPFSLPAYAWGVRGRVP